jgi:arsenate reductase
MKRKTVVLFVCNHNAGRSQMAEGYLRSMAPDDFEPVSAGSNPADAINPVVVEAMAEEGLSLGEARPKRLNLAMTARADYIITMGCEEGCLAHKDEDWALDDPAGKSVAEIRPIRDDIKRRVEALVERLRAANPDGRP